MPSFVTTLSSSATFRQNAFNRVKLCPKLSNLCKHPSGSCKIFARVRQIPVKVAKFGQSCQVRAKLSDFAKGCHVKLRRSCRIWSKAVVLRQRCHRRFIQFCKASLGSVIFRTASSKLCAILTCLRRKPRCKSRRCAWECRGCCFCIPETLTRVPGNNGFAPRNTVPAV